MLLIITIYFSLVIPTWPAKLTNNLEKSSCWWAKQTIAHLNQDLLGWSSYRYDCCKDIAAVSNLVGMICLRQHSDGHSLPRCYCVVFRPLYPRINSGSIWIQGRYACMLSPKIFNSSKIVFTERFWFQSLLLKMILELQWKELFEYGKFINLHSHRTISYFQFFELSVILLMPLNSLFLKFCLIAFHTA